MNHLSTIAEMFSCSWVLMDFLAVNMDFVAVHASVPVHNNVECRMDWRAGRTWFVL